MKTKIGNNITNLFKQIRYWNTICLIILCSPINCGFWFVWSFLFLFLFLFVCLFVCLFVFELFWGFLFLFLFVCLFVCLFCIVLGFFVFVCLFVFELFWGFLFLFLFVCLFFNCFVLFFVVFFAAVLTVKTRSIILRIYRAHMGA